jgi:CRISPR-associated endonuclease/helicase Cas3
LEYKSHPNVLLDQHVESLIRYSRNFKSHKDDGVLEEAILYHDWGKKNKFFQERIEKILKGEEVERDLRRDKHAVLSTINYMITSQKSDKDYLMILNMVLGHHGSLRSFDLLMDQLYKYIEDSDLKESYESIEEVDSIELRTKYFVLEDLWYELSKDWTSEDGVRIRNYFSQLIDADRLSAMRNSDYNHDDLSERGFNKEATHYIEALGYDMNNPLDVIRKDIKLDINALLNKVRGTYTLTLPTGMGKTIAAAKIAEKNKNKVIYVVPYLSVADQTWEVFHDIYKHRNYEGSWDFLVKHDSRLNEMTFTKDPHDDKINVRDLITSWRSKIIITTTVQFFESLISLNSSNLRKVHNTHGATILIDEPQAIPYEKWEFLKKIVDLYAKELNWKVIYLSATPPTMTSGVINLVKNEKYIFNQLGRTEIEYLGTKGGYQGVNDWVSEARRLTRDNKQVLWLLNVEKLARKVYEYALLLVKDRKVVFISGKLPPIVRFYKIKKIREMMKNGEKLLVVSTQVLEAGVDLDFDGVVRDLAPFPVLIQVAGRLNRKWHRKRERLYVMQLMENTVYSDFEFRHTGHILYQRGNLILEEDYYDACKEYYSLCEEMPPVDTPSEWMDQFVHLRESSLQMIESPDYQTTAICSNMRDFLKNLEQSELEEFKSIVKEITGVTYTDIYEIIYNIANLEDLIENGKVNTYKNIKDLKNLRRNLSWYETSCNITEVEDYDIEGRKFYLMEVPDVFLKF